jgi:hypothetical protein
MLKKMRDKSKKRKEGFLLTLERSNLSRMTVKMFHQNKTKKVKFSINIFEENLTVIIFQL